MTYVGRSRVRSVIALSAIAIGYSAVAMIPLGTGAPDAPLTVVCGWALAAAVVLAARRMPVGRRRQFGVWFALVFLNLAAVAVEGSLFAPAASPPWSLAANLVRLLVAALLVAGAVAILLGGEGDSDLPSTTSRPLSSWLWRVLAAAAIYLVLYLVIGGINYSLITRSYYESHAGSLTVPPAQMVFLYEPLRGLLIALSTLPLTLALRLRTGQVALIAGLLLFVIGGVVPLLPQTSLPLYLRVASLWEIFGQNFLTGVACAYLFTGSHRTALRRADSRTP